MEVQKPPKHPDRFPLVNEPLLCEILDPETPVDLGDLRLALRNCAVTAFDRRILRLPFWEIVDHVCKAEHWLSVFEVQATMMRAYVKDKQDTTVLKQQMKQSWDTLSVERRALIKAIETLMECRTSEQALN